MWKLSVKIISFAAFFSCSHFSVAKMMFVQGAGAVVQQAKYVLFYKIRRWSFYILFTMALIDSSKLVNNNKNKSAAYCGPLYGPQYKKKVELLS